MAKKPAAHTSLTRAQLKAVAAATPPAQQVINVPSGGTLVVIVDVGPMTVPYTVSYAGRTVLKALVDRAVSIPLLPGDQVLGWSFTHLAKAWHHTIGVSVNSGTPTVLESNSEDGKDSDVSVNFATVKA
jgi:hypothetical protein